MVHEVLRVAGRIAVEELDADESARHGGHKGGDPVRRAVGVEGDLVARAEPRLAPKQVEGLDFSGQIGVAQGVVSVVVQGGLLPAALDRLFETQDKGFHAVGDMEW